MYGSRDSGIRGMFIKVGIALAVILLLYQLGHGFYLGAIQAPKVIASAHREVDQIMLKLYNLQRERHREEVNAEVDRLNREEESADTCYRWYVKRYGFPEADEMPSPPGELEFTDDKGDECRLVNIQWTNHPHKPRIISCRIEQPFSYTYQKK